jgi:hypothetical protein
MVANAPPVRLLGGHLSRRNPDLALRGFRASFGTPEEGVMRTRVSLALLLAATGCSTTYKVSPAEISRLNGWFVPDLVKRTPGDGRLDDPRDLQLRDVEGRMHAFTEDTPLVLVRRDGSVITEKFLDVSVDGQNFRGVPQEAFRRTVEVPMSEVQSAGIQELSKGRTALLVSSIGAVMLGALIGARLAIGNPPPRPTPGNPCGDAGCSF